MSDRTAVISADKVDASAVPTLVPQGPFLGKPDIPLNRSVITVGSGDKSRLHLVSSTISSAHALLVKSGGQTYIADMASRTGIQINGKPTSFSYLKPGDRLQIGRFVFRFRSPQASTNFPPSPPPASVDVTGELPIDLGEKPVFTIGRRDNNDLPLTGDRNVSTVHAVIFAVDGQWYLRDLHTRTGTRLNGSGIHQHQLDFNDEIQIGSFKMRFQPAATDSPASASGLDFSVEAATTTAEPPELDLPPLTVDEDAAIPLEIDEPLTPRADRPEVPLAPVIPVEDLAPVPTEEVEAPLEAADPFVEAELPIPEPDEVDMSPLEALEPLADLEVDPSSPVEAEAVIPEVEPAVFEPLAEIPLELEEPVAEAEALSPVEVEPAAEPVADVPLEVEEPHAEPVAAAPVEHEENPFAAAEPLAEAPLEVEEPAIEPVAETADVHPAAAAEPEELDFAELESLEPDLLSSDAPDELAAETVSEAPAEVEEPAIEPVVEAPEVHAAAAAEPEELDLSALEPFEAELPSAAAPEEIPAEEIHAAAVQSEALSEENPFAEVTPEAEEPAIEPVAEIPEVHPAAAAELEELDLSAFESSEPEALESPAPGEVPAAEIYPAVTEPQPVAELPLELEDLDEAIISAPISPAGEVDDLDQSLLESLEEFPVIESEPSPHAALDLEDLTAEPAAVPLPTYSDLSEEPVAAAVPVEVELPSTIPADVADLIYTAEEPQPAPAAPEPEPAKPAKPKRKWWSRKKKERTPPPAPTPPAIEILDATEPTLESALEMSTADTSTPDVSSESLSDTTFSRAVEEFAGASTGPIIEEPLHPVEKIEPEPASLPLTLDEITDGEEFVAVPEAEPDAPLEVAAVEPQSHTEEVFQPPSLTYTPTQDNQQTLADSTPVETAPPLDEPTVTDPALSEPPPVKTSTPPPPPFEPLPISTAAQPPIAPPPTSVTASRPSIFGFQFEGGSFLGGMPLRLKPLSPETNKTIAPPPPVEAKPESRIEPPPPAPIEPAPTPTIVDDVPPAESIEPPPAAPVEPARPAAPLTFTNYAPTTEPVVMPIKQPPPVPPAAPQPTAATIKTPPRPAPLPRPKRLADAMAVPPMAQSAPTTTPPRRNLTTAFDGLAPRSLTGGMVGGQQKTPPPVRGFGVPGARETVRGADVFSQVAAPISVEVFGAVQGNARDFVIPDTRKPLMPTPPRTPPGPPPTSAFGNGDGNGDIPPPPTEEEFQEASIPTEPLTDMLEPPQEELQIALPADADPAPQLHHQPQVHTPKPRRSRVPVLLVLMILLLAGAWAGVYYFLSPVSRVTGSLAFSNLADQPMSDQLIFQHMQNARLNSEEVRSMARSMLVSSNQDPGFLDDAVQFEQALTKTGKVEFVDNGEKLQLTTRVSDATLGKARVDALLQSLKQKDADLVDLQARAKRASDDAHAAVTQTKAHLEDLQAQRTAAQARGENRPDPQEIASVTADDERLNKAWTLAKSDLADARTALTDLQSLSTDKPPTADTDPQLTRLRRESGDLDQQISALQLIVDAGHSTLDQDNQLADLKTQSDDLASSIKQRQTQLLADQALTPQQREVNRQKQIEALSVKVTDLEKAESDAKSAANASAVRLAELNTRLAQARQASTDDLITQISAARDDLKAKTDDETEKEKQLTACISLAGDPQVSVQALSDQRPIFAGGASVVILIIFSLMIVSASRSASAAIADRPAPHPQPHPADDADEPSPASL